MPPRGIRLSPGKAPQGRAIAGPTLIQTPAVRRALQSIQADVKSKTRDARRVIGNESWAKLINPSTSRVNVDTGHMQRSYKWKVASGNNRIDIFNTATSKKGFRYPLFVEKRYGQGTARTLRTHRGTIARNTRRRLTRRVPQSKMGGEL